MVVGHSGLRRIATRDQNGLELAQGRLAMKCSWSQTLIPTDRINEHCNRKLRRIPPPEYQFLLKDSAMLLYAAFDPLFYPSELSLSAFHIGRAPPLIIATSSLSSHPSLKKLKDSLLSLLRPPSKPHRKSSSLIHNWEAPPKKTNNNSTFGYFTPYIT